MNIEHLTEQLCTGIEKFVQTDQYQSYLRTLSRFPTYSFNNTMLIWLQNPNATYVAGYRTWINDFQRNVRKGEKGIRIYAPIIKKRDEDGETIVGYRAISVFDISQTVGKELPLLKPEILNEHVSDVQFFTALCQISPVPVRFDVIEGTALGYFDQTKKEIVLRPGLPELQTIKTLVHEIAHAQMHAHRQEDIRLMETEAESVAYMVLQYFGYDTSAYSFPYIATWCDPDHLNDLRNALTNVSITANQMIMKLAWMLQENQKSESVPIIQPQTSSHIPTVLAQ